MADINWLSFVVKANYYNKQGVLTYTTSLDLWYMEDPDTENTPVCTSSNPNLPSSLSDCAPWVELDCGVGVYNDGTLYSYQNFDEVMKSNIGPDGLHIYPESYINGEDTGGDSGDAEEGYVYEGQIFCNYYDPYGVRIHSAWVQCYANETAGDGYSTSPNIPEGLLEEYDIISWAEYEGHSFGVKSDGSLTSWGSFGSSIGGSIDIIPYSYYIYLTYYKNNENITEEPEKEKYATAIDGSYENQVTISDFYYNTNNGAYSFMGWSSKDGANYQPGDSIALNSNLDLYAQWALSNPIDYTINYFANESDILLTENYNSSELEPQYTLNTIVPNNETQTFVEWNWEDTNKTIKPGATIVLNPNISTVNLLPIWQELPEPLTKSYSFVKKDGKWVPIKLYSKINGKWL